MKKTLAFDRYAQQFRCDVGQPAKRFYLGGDSDLAQRRKMKLAALWEQHRATGGQDWTDELITQANAIRRGLAPEVRQKAGGQKPGESEEQYRERAAEFALATKTPIQPTATLQDYVAVLNDRIAELEALVRDKLGEGAVVGPSITIHDALNEWSKYRHATEIDPDTGEATEHARTEANTVNFIKRHVEDMPLSRLSFIEIQKWCKVIANRPLAKKSGEPIKLSTAKNCLKTIRLFIKWASHNYQWRKPDEWHDATKVLLRRSKEERRELLSKLERHYTPAEIGTLWKFARPMERLLILLGLNFGYAQAEILNMTPADLASESCPAIRAKTCVVGKWPVWEETGALGKTEFSHIPKTRQGVINQWAKLYKRIRKDHADFKYLSFKWLRKSGSSLIRQIAGGEIASTYISHGESASTDDDLLEVYASTDWNAVGSAVNRLRAMLLPHLQGNASTAKNHIPRSTIEKVQDGWKQGLHWKEICKVAGVSRDTVYKYRVSKAAAQPVE